MDLLKRSLIPFYAVLLAVASVFASHDEKPALNRNIRFGLLDVCSTGATNASLGEWGRQIEASSAPRKKRDVGSVPLPPREPGYGSSRTKTLQYSPGCQTFAQLIPEF